MQYRPEKRNKLSLAARLSIIYSKIFLSVSQTTPVASSTMTSRILSAPMRQSMQNLHSEQSLHAAADYVVKLVILLP